MNNIRLRKVKMGLLDTIIYIWGILVLSTAATSLNPFSIYLNRILMGLYMVIALWIICQKMNVKTFVYLCFLLIVEVLTILNTNASLENFNDMIYLPLWSLTLLLFINKYTLMRETILLHCRFLKNIGIICVLVFLISIPFSSSYTYSGAFISFASGEHRFAEVCLFIICCFLIDYFITRHKHNLLLIILAMVFIYASQTRTYIVVAMIIVLFYLIKFGGNIRQRYILIIIGLFIAGNIAYYLAVSKLEQAMGSWALQTRGPLYIITSGRSRFWEGDIRSFFSEGFLGIMFGKGYNYVYDVNEIYSGARIWAHNDYINVLLASGLLGLFVYFYPFIQLVKRIKSHSNYKMIYAILFCITIIFNAMFNMVYSYTVANLITPILGIVIIDTDFFLSFRNKH